MLLTCCAAPPGLPERRHLMGVFVLLLLEIVVQLLAVGLAFRLARISGRLAPWGALGAAIGVLALWQFVDVVRIATGAIAAHAIGALVEDLIFSLLLLLGLALMLRRFQATQCECMAT
jgi:hypothetical protein